MKTLNRLNWSWNDDNENQIVFSESASSLLDMGNSLMASDSNAIAVSTFMLILDVDLSRMEGPEYLRDLLPESASENMKTLLVKAWPYITSRPNPGVVIQRIDASVPLSIPLSDILPPRPTAAVVATTVWRLVNAWTWCLLPNRRKLSRSLLSRSTWDAISLHVDPTVLAKNPEGGQADSGLDETIDPDSVVFVPSQLVVETRED